MVITRKIDRVVERLDANDSLFASYLDLLVEKLNIYGYTAKTPTANPVAFEYLLRE